MIRVPNMILIGAAGRNVGKTEFACELIKRYHSTETVVGVKITTIREMDGKCPRGGDGCGVCTSLTQDYMITEESCGPEGKDTVRMLNAGAHQVLWLRVLKEALEEGVAALMKRIPNDACLVCESNSARLVIDPGVFIVVKEKGNDTIKKTCEAVMDRATTMISFSDMSWDITPGRFEFNEGTWIYHEV
jgi:hypothetical protein